MRVLHVVNDFLPFTRAGTEHYIAELTAAQAARGAQPLILHLMPAPLREGSTVRDWQLLPGRYLHAPTWMLALPAQEREQATQPELQAALAPWLQEQAPDVAHVHSFIGFSVSLLDALPPEMPVVLTLHDFWLLCANAILVHSNGEMCSGPRSEDKCARCVAERMGKAQPETAFIRERMEAHKRAAKRLDAVIAPSRFSLNMHRMYGFDVPGLARMPLGMWPVEPQAPSLEESLSHELRFACLGGINWFKGQDLAISAFMALGMPHLRLDIHGRVSNQIFYDQLLRHVKDTPNIHWHGAYTKKDLSRILGNCDVVLLPSRIESYSFVAREALSAGVPVIAADCGALPEIVRHGKNGLLFKSGNAASLAQKMALVAQDQDLLGRLRAGIAPVVSMEEDVRRLLQRYEILLEEKREKGSRPQDSDLEV